MKKETSSAKTSSKPKGNEKKASAKKSLVSHPDTPAIKGTEVTCQASEQVTNHTPDWKIQSGLTPCASLDRPPGLILG